MYYTCAREICFNHQSEALPRFYVISVEFSLINLGQSQLWVCHTNQNSLNTANSRTTYIFWWMEIHFQVVLMAKIL